MLREIVILALIISTVGSYNVLVVFPLLTKSHSILAYGYVRPLINAGHEVTLITPFPQSNQSNKIKTVDISSNLAYLTDNVINITNIMEGSSNGVSQFVFPLVAPFLSELGVKHENVQRLLLDKSLKFDVVIAEWFFTELLAGFAAVYQCPLIWAGNTDSHWQILKAVDEATHPAYTADILSTRVPPFSFWDRLQELWAQVYIIIMKWWTQSAHASMYTNGFGPAFTTRGLQMPEYNDIIYNSSMILANSHVAFGFPHRLPQSVKNIGGYHIEEPTPPLPEDLKNILDNATEGFIYFSLGSMLKSSHMSNAIITQMLEMFESLGLTVVWKLEEFTGNLPPNVHIQRWMPQQSILAHPNIKIFITHGGYLSTIETIYYGVPIISIPIYGDQFVNAKTSVKNGFAIEVPLQKTLLPQLRSAIHEMLTNQRYSLKAKELSRVYHDRPLGAGEELVYWVEHVVRTKGAPHLRSPALNVPLYQKLYLDIALFLLGILFTLCTVVVLFIKITKNSIVPSKLQQKKEK